MLMKLLAKNVLFKIIFDLMDLFVVRLLKLYIETTLEKEFDYNKAWIIALLSFGEIILIQYIRHLTIYFFIWWHFSVFWSYPITASLMK